MDTNTNASVYDVRRMRRNHTIRIALCMAGLGILLGGIGLPAAYKAGSDFKARMSQKLIEDELAKLPKDAATLNAAGLRLKLSQCEFQVEDFAGRLATIGAAVDLGDR